MFKILKYFSEYKKESILGPLFKLLEALFELFVPLVIASIIDKGISNNDFSYILKMCLILILLGIIGLICSITAQFFAAKASVGFATKLRHILYNHIQSFSYSNIDKIGTSTLITRMTSDINQVQSGMNLFLRLFLRSPFVVFGAMIMAFTIDIKCALIFLYTIPILTIVIFGIMLITMPLYKKTQKGLDKILLKTKENLTGARVIRAFGLEENEIENFNTENNNYIKLQKFTGKISSLMNPLTYIIINASIIILIYSGAIRVNIGILTQGQVIALYNYMSQILVELIKLANMIITLTKAIASGNRIQDVLEIQNEIKNGEEKNIENSENIIEFSNVYLKYNENADPALENINFSVKKGETIGIIGATGSGKSSLINLIPRFYDTSNGNIKIFGKNIKEYDTKTLRSKIGIVPQKAILFKGTIEKNMKFGGEEISYSSIETAIDTAQAKDVVNGKGGLNGEVEQNGRNFSGGQRQRLTIARALAKEPEILILDDSASALDFATDAKLRKSIRELKFNPTVFIVSQRSSSVMFTDKIIVLDDGEIKGIGTHKELMKNCEIYQEIYYSQFPKDKEDNE